MSTKSINRRPSLNADTDHFCEIPTLAAAPLKSDDISLFSLPTEVFPADQDKLAKAPVSDAYVITHELATGGYGTIWNGIQKNLNRRVALKSLKPDMAYGPNYERVARLFRQEALTTAYLQHPNVVPVYDLTSDSKGRPLLAMKLIEGRQWNRVLADEFAITSPLEFLESQVPVLINVAQAVAFAHSKGIIHRDLKPSQIMIGSYGEVVLMDWGLAMAARDADGQVICDGAVIIDAQSPLVKPISPAGTPGYMAPEQLGKDTSRIGPWTDVYLLGAVLYELLTGRRPHDPDTDSKDGPSKSAEIIKPEVRTPDRDIPAQLSALAMKAMSHRPSDRVASASAFVSELKDYLVKAGRRGESMALVTDVANTVIACEHTYEHLQTCLDKLDSALAQWPENQMATYLRHQTLVTFARTALANHDLKLARHQAERLHLCHERHSIINEIEMAEAEYRTRDSRVVKARTQARDDRQRAEGLVRFLLLDLHMELRALGRADLVYQVASHALKFFDSLHEEETNTATLQNRTIAYLQIGDVLSEQARRDEAEIAYSRALDVTHSVDVLQPDDTEWQILRCRVLNSLGRLHYIMGRMDVAVSEFDHSLDMCREIAREYPDDIEIRRLIGHTLHDLALVYWRNQDQYTALLKIDESLQSARELYQKNPSNADYQTDLAGCLASRTNILRETGDLKGSINSAYESLALRIALSEQFPGNAGHAEDVFWVRGNLGNLLMASGDLEAALDTLRQDLAGRRRMYEEDTANVLRTIGLTFHLSMLAESHFLLYKTEEAERLLAECLLHSRHLAQIDESNPTVVSRYALHMVQMAELQISKGHWTEGERLVTHALERARYSYWLSPQNYVVLRPLAQALALYSRTCERADRTDEAHQTMSEGLNILQQVKGDVDSRSYRALKARLIMGRCQDSEREQLIDSLRQDRRLDPYLAAWIQEFPTDAMSAVS